jgi:hypothetical protein
MLSRPIPQSSVGRLVSLSVDNSQYYTHPSSLSGRNSSPPPPPLVPIASLAVTGAATNETTTNDNEEKTMLWRNIANLFAKYDNMEQDHESVKRRSDEIYQDLRNVWDEVEQIHTDIAENNVLSKHVRKIRKYVNKKCDKLKDDINYGSSSANDEIFAYIEKLRSEFDTRIKNLQNENVRHQEEMAELNDTYYRDYEMFVQRENDLMAKLDAAVSANEALNERLKHVEDTMKHQLNIKNYKMDELREEITRAIMKEREFESKTRAQVVQNMNEQLTDLITRSNEYHSYRYFGTLEHIKQIQENSETLKKSIGMVDLELSDVRESVDQMIDDIGQNTTDVSNVQEDVADLKEVMYRELDRDYYDLKDYVKRHIHRHEKKYHPRCQQAEDTIERAVAPTQGDDPIQLIVNEYAEQQQQQQQQQPEEREEHVIIIDENTFDSDDEVLAPQV